ncbi:MAG: glutamine-hydrolyzing GMP synthase [Pseudomonadota bacterium]
MNKDIHSQRILILDFGSQYCQLIARRVREIGVYCEIYAYDTDPENITKFAPQGVILSGGPETVCGEETPRIPDAVFNLGCPVLGICYGMQALTTQLGGSVTLAERQEFGYAKMNILSNSLLWHGLQGEQHLDTWMSHGDHVIKLPDGFQIIGNTSNTDIAAIADESRHYYAVQFHPEVTHTLKGKMILENFVCRICACEKTWTTENIIADLSEHIKTQVGDDKVILALSGGVDSSVLAALLHHAIGDQLTCIFVDNGLLRLNEAEQVKQTIDEHFHIKLICVDARQHFLSALNNINDPEQKRKIIGKTFIDIFEQEAAKLDVIQWLAQGTIYPDVIESAGAKTGKAKVIKSHHNVGGLPEKLKFKLIEPLRELFKDEVRKIGLKLGLPEHIVFRHPFPGPGLAVRMLGAIDVDQLDCLRQADAIFIEELRKADLYHKVKQAFAVFLPVNSVGVVGDARCYSPVIALRAVETTDFMTAHWAHLPHDFLAHVSYRITNEVRNISRVVYDISGKPPATIEWE